MKNFLKSIPFTPQKYKEMQAKVVKFEAEKIQVMQRLVDARAMGDLSENGAYKYAKFEMGNLNRQLKRFKNLLEKGFPAPKNTGPKGLIDFGSTITLKKLDQELTKTFMIVSEHESDPSNSKLAYSSPMGKAVMRKKVGDTVSFKTPKGKSEWLILEVK